MNGNEEPVEIEVEPEIHDLLPFEDFYLDQFVDYIENESDDVNGHSRTPNNITNHTQSSQYSSTSERFFYKCTVCREILGSAKELLSHVRTHTRSIAHHNSQSAKYNKNVSMTKCCICMRSFGNVEKLRVHEQTQHQPPFRCRFCNSFFTIFKFYRNHIQMHRHEYSRVPDQINSHHGNSKHLKKTAYKKHFYTPPTVAAHAVQNSNSNHGLLAQQQQQQLYYGNSQTPLKCKYCNKLFGKISVLRKHEMLHKNCTNDYKFPPKVDVEVMDTSHTPLLSNKSSNTSSALTLTPSLLSNLNKLANLKSTECTDGSKKPAILININTNDATQKHNEVTKKSQEMPLNSNSGLMISSVTTIDTNHFDTMEKQRQANNATVLIHNGGKKAVSLADLQCPICKKIVSQPFSLKVHLRTHTLEKPYTCPVCQKSFSQSCNLKTHMNIHNKQNHVQQGASQHPLKCNICNKTFLKASSLNTHMISHTAKLYCYACNINFNDDAVAYSQHMQQIHNVTMTKDLISRAKANLQKSESAHQQQQQKELIQMQAIKKECLSEDESEVPQKLTETPQQQSQRIMEVFQVQSTSVPNGQIPKLRITLKKDPVQSNNFNNNNNSNKDDQEADGNESDSSSSSSSSSNSSSSSSSSSSSTSSNSEKNDNN